MSIPKVRGIPNIGNTCYQNATLQLLLSIPEFTNLLTDPNVYDAFKDGNRHSNWLKRLIVFVNHYHTNPNEEQMHRSFREYYDMICQTGLFEIGSQEDAHELLGPGILDTLIDYYDKYPPHLSGKKELLPQIHPFISNLNVISVQSFFFSGQPDPISRLPGKHPTYPRKLGSRVENGNEVFLRLSDEIQSLLPTISLDELTKKWRSIEIEMGPPLDPNIKTDVIKRMFQVQLNHLDKYLFIRLGRENPVTVKKINSRVIMPHFYNFRILLDEDPASDPSTPSNHGYALVGVIHHHSFGDQGLQGGHYTASILSDGKWMFCNDSIIKPHMVSEIKDLANSSTGYIYLYRRLDGLSTKSAEILKPYGPGVDWDEGYRLEFDSGLILPRSLDLKSDFGGPFSPRPIVSDDDFEHMFAPHFNRHMSAVSDSEYDESKSDSISSLPSGF